MISSSNFFTDGFTPVVNVISEAKCRRIADGISLADAGVAGSRCLLAQSWYAKLAKRLRHSTLFSGLIADSFVAVQCTYFEKSAYTNWKVPVHQDLSIPVLEKVDHPALTGWSEKEGEIFVHAPFEILEQLVIVRLHLDPCGPKDGPVRVYAGSHRLGRIDSALAAQERMNFAEVACVAEIGTALVMRPLLLHASSKAIGTSRRRVLHFLFGPPVLPLGLQWRYTV